MNEFVRYRFFMEKVDLKENLIISSLKNDIIMLTMRKQKDIIK